MYLRQRKYRLFRRISQIKPRVFLLFHVLLDSLQRVFANNYFSVNAAVAVALSSFTERNPIGHRTQSDRTADAIRSDGGRNPIGRWTRAVARSHYKQPIRIPQRAEDFNKHIAQYYTYLCTFCSFEHKQTSSRYFVCHFAKTATKSFISKS